MWCFSAAEVREDAPSDRWQEEQVLNCLSSGPCCNNIHGSWGLCLMIFVLHPISCLFIQSCLIIIPHGEATTKAFTTTASLSLHRTGRQPTCFFFWVIQDNPRSLTSQVSYDEVRRISPHMWSWSAQGGKDWADSWELKTRQGNDESYFSTMNHLRCSVKLWYISYGSSGGLGRPDIHVGAHIYRSALRDIYIFEWFSSNWIDLTGTDSPAYTRECGHPFYLSSSELV